MLLYQAVEKYSAWRFGNTEKATVQHDYHFLRFFCLFCRNKNVEDVKEEDITEYIKLHYDLGYKTNGIQMRVSAVRGMLSYLGLKGENVINPKLIKTPKKEWAEVRVATEEGYRKLLSVIPDLRQPGNYHTRNRAMIMMLWDTGMRAGELASMKTEDIDTDNMMCSIRTEKNRSSIPFRNVFWTEATNERIIQWKKKRTKLEGEYFFCGLTKGSAGLYLSVTAIACVLRKYARRNDLPVLNPHSFRHAFGERMAMKGAEDSVISSLMGHSHVESSYRYTRLSKENMREKYKVLTGGA